jgi:hypothetical protein
MPNENEELFPTEICDLEFKARTLSGDDSELLAQARDSEIRLYEHLRRSVNSRFPNARITNLDIQKGSVVVYATLIVIGKFATDYKDVKEAVEELVDDLEGIICAFFEGLSKKSVRVNSRISYNRKNRRLFASQPRTTMKSKLAGVIAALIALAVASAAVFYSEKDSKASHQPVNVVATTEARVSEATAVVSCAHCDAKGSCHAEQSQLSCQSCRKHFGIEDKEGKAIAICSVCKGMGYTIPSLQSLQARQPFYISIAVCFATFMFLLMWPIINQRRW